MVKSSKKITPYKTLILNKLYDINKEESGDFSSRISLINDLYSKRKFSYSKRRFKSFLKRALSKLVDNNVICQKRDSFRLSSKHLAKMVKRGKAVKTQSKVKKASSVSKTVKKPKKTTNVTNKLQKSAKTNQKKKIKKVFNPSLSLVPITQAANTSLFSSVPLITSLFSNTFSNMPLVAPSKIEKSKTKKENYKKRWLAVWQYYDSNNVNAKIKKSDGWYDYDAEASDMVEDEWQKYIVNRGMNDVRSVRSGDWAYMVDFIGWQQQNIEHSSHTKRKIRRLDENGQVTQNPYV
jgi:hypothetical protein